MSWDLRDSDRAETEVMRATERMENGGLCSKAMRITQMFKDKL